MRMISPPGFASPGVITNGLTQQQQAVQRSSPTSDSSRSNRSWHSSRDSPHIKKSQEYQSRAIGLEYKPADELLPVKGNGQHDFGWVKDILDMGSKAFEDVDVDLFLMDKLGFRQNRRPNPRPVEEFYGPTLQKNTDWEMLSIEEAVNSLHHTVEPPSMEYLICILQKCRKKQSIADAKQVHLHICKHGLEVHITLGNHLVSVFVECGSMPDACRIFNTLDRRNEHSWTSLIQGYTDCWELHSAVDLFWEMQEDCARPSSYTYVAMLKACARMKCLEKGQAVHAEVSKEGHEGDLIVGSTLVDFYARCGLPAEAQESFDALEVRDVVSWTALMAGYVEGGLGEEALNCVETMQLDGVSPDARTFVCSLKASSNLGFLDRGCEIHVKIVVNGFETDLFVGNTLVDMYAKFDLLSEAREVLDELPVRDLVSWNALIAGYAEHGLGEQALNCFKQMKLEGLSPNAITFASMLKACCSVEAGQGIHVEMAKEESEIDDFVGSALIDMYTNCGLLADAREVFNELPSQNVVLWNTLIAGLTEHGFGEDAFDCLKEMQLEQVSPDAVTYVCCLKACSNAGFIDRARNLHAEIAKQGFEIDRSVGSTLINTYQKCGFPTEAKEVFDSLPVQNVALWNALIAGFTEHDRNDEALNCLKQMASEGISPDAVTYASCLNACSKRGALQRGRDIHADIVKDKLESDPFVICSLLDMYADWGSLEEAWGVFDEVLGRDVIVWNALINGYVKHRFAIEALRFLDLMQAEYVSPNAATYVSGLKACGILKAIDKGHEMHVKITKEGFEVDLFVGSTLVDMYAKCGSLVEAREVFDEMVVQNVVSWTALIAGYAEHGHGEEALSCFKLMHLDGISPNAATFHCSLKACCSVEFIRRGREVYADIVKQGFEMESSICSALVDMHAKCSSVAEMQEVFNNLPVRDVNSWNALIAVYADYGLQDKVLDCLEQMQVEGVSPDTITLVCSLKVCGSIGATERGQEVHSQIVKQDFERDSYVGNTLVYMYGKCGLFEEAHAVFDKLPGGDVVSWNALMVGYAEHGHSDKALTFFEEMQVLGISASLVSWNILMLGYAEQGEVEKPFTLYGQMQEQGLLPNHVTFVIISTTCGNMSTLRIGKEIHARTQNGHLFAEVILANTIIDMYCKCGRMDDAQEVFNEMPTRNLVTWNALITGFARQGERELIFEWFERMRGEGTQPDEVTFLNVLTACCHGGLLDEGQRYFEAMSEEYSIIPTIKHHNCMVDLLGRAGRLDEALMMLEKMSVHPDLVTRNILLAACCTWGNMELAFESLVASVERHNFGSLVASDDAFTSMYYINEDAQLWDNNAQEPEVMRSNTQACKESRKVQSEVGGLLHASIFGDKTPLSKKEIYIHLQS